MTTVNINGHSIFYREVGDVRLPPLVIVHGLYGESAGLVPLAELFASHFRVILPDAIGHGRSEHPTDFTLEDQGRMLNSLVAALGYDSATLMGISMGSYLCAQAAILEPARSSHLVLIVTKPQGKTSSVAAYAAREGFDLGAATPEDLLALMAGAIWSPNTSQERRDAILAGQSPDQIVLTADERAAVERSLAGFDLRPGLPSITAPTLVISGRSDGLNPPEVGKEVADLIPDARFEIYENSGHMLASEEDERLVAEVTEFVLGS